MNPPQLPLPPRMHTAAGKIRRIGVELEFIGLELETISRIVAQLFDGQIERISAYEHRVTSERLGTFQVELDFHYLKELGRNPKPDSLLDELSEEMLRSLAEGLVPLEVVAPPLAMTQLGELELLVAALRKAGAQGTFSEPLNAFGLHLNPELPDLESATLLAYLQAFCCLYDWLKEQGQIDLTRRLTPYITHFPKEYIQQLLDPAYLPDQATLIDDYLAANPTRNRALDLLPLFLHLDPERLRAQLDDPRINARPTLHYRLPNCEIDRPDWGIHRAWGEWLQVEYLAADPPRLHAIATAYRNHLETSWFSHAEEWSKESEEWLITLPKNQ